MRWSRADLHLHTTCSDGLHTPEQLAQHLVRTPLAAAAVTDHDTIAGALRVEEALAGNGPEIVIASEVSSADGHVLGLFLSRDVPSGLSASETVAAIHDQGGLAVAAHPYSLAMGVRDLAAELPFDGVEILNGSPLMDLSNSRAASRLRGRAADVGGSDAHVAWAAGRVHTVFPGTGAADLRAAILARQTHAAADWAGHLAVLPVHLAWLTWLMVRNRARPANATSSVPPLETSGRQDAECAQLTTQAFPPEPGACSQERGSARGGGQPAPPTAGRSLDELNDGRL